MSLPASNLFVVTLLILATAGLAQAAPQPDARTAPPVTAPGDDFGLRLDTDGTGWASIDIHAVRPMDLHLHVTHDALKDLCTFTSDGLGIYDDGHYTAIHLWKLDSGSPFEGRFFTWLGSPHIPLPILQTGICGDLNGLRLEAGDTARLVVASTVPGFHLELLGSDREDAPRSRGLALAPHPELKTTEPEAEALVAEAGSRAILALQKEWRSTFDLGPAVLYGLPWLHAEADDDPFVPHAFHDAGLRQWGFDGADFSGNAQDGPTMRGDIAPLYDWVAVFPGWTTGGHIEGFVREEALVGAHTSQHETGVKFLSIPLEAVA